MSTRVRSYRLAHAGNAGKVEALRGLLPWWQRGLVHVQLLQVRAMKRGARLGLLDTKGMPSYLSQRQWKSVVNQVNAALRSWQELAIIEIRAVIRDGDYDDETRKRLYRLNKAKVWWSDPETDRLITDLARTRLPFPNLSRVRTMLMDGPIAQVEASESDAFTFWVRFSLNHDQKPIRVPLHGNVYFDDAAGSVGNFIQLHLPEDRDGGGIEVRLVKKSKATELRTEGRDIGADWGLATLVVTSDGDRLGQALYAWLVARDAELTTLTARLSQQGIRLRDSKRYRALTQRIRGYVKNEIGRVLNQIAADEGIRSITVESLDFRGSDRLSPRLRRLVSRAGRAAFKAKLAALEEDHGITIHDVNSAYTSQECSGCGYAAKNNRRTQSRFTCRFCSKTIHADVNAARIILTRRSRRDGYHHTSKHAVLSDLDRRFHSSWGVAAAEIRQRHTRPHSRAASNATSRAGSEQ